MTLLDRHEQSCCHPFGFILCAAACGGSEPVDDDAREYDGLSTVVRRGQCDRRRRPQRGRTTRRPHRYRRYATDAAFAGSRRRYPGAIPGPLGHGPADCTSTRGDNKGLITIGDTSIRFYESTATLTEQRPRSRPASPVFAFPGEGQSWKRSMTFTRTGNTLKRADPEGSFTYSAAPDPLSFRFAGARPRLACKSRDIAAGCCADEV